ncbi:MAG: hypothetical protein K2Q33_02550 [Gammaproteobacteria bacterium]|nr:hypothetical protein [Gammaproteobacteria bacterium]
MPKNYENVVIFSFACQVDFANVQRLKEKYPKLHHVVLTDNPESDKLAQLKAQYPHLADGIVDINDINEKGTGMGRAPRLKCTITANTKVIIIGHGQANSNFISSTDSEDITMHELASLLKRNGKDTTMRISFLTCGAGTGAKINNIDGSIANELYRELEALGINAIISAPTFGVYLYPQDGRKYVFPLVEDDLNMDYFNPLFCETKIQNDIIQATSKFPLMPIRRDFEKLYDRESFLLTQGINKSLGSKVIISQNGPKFPYGEFRQEDISSINDERTKLLYEYRQKQKEYRIEARKICLNYLYEIYRENPNLMDYEGLLKLENTINHYIYPYPAFLSYNANNRIGETQTVENPIFKIKNENNKEREECLYQALKQFQNKINNNPRLKQIQQEHMECAESIATKYHKAMNNIHSTKSSGGMAENLAQYGFHSRSGHSDENSNLVEKTNFSKTC